MIERRTRLAGRVFAVVLLIFALRMAYLQTLRYRELLGASISNQLQTVPTDAPRGEIYDRNREPLVTNRPSFTLQMFAPGDDARLEEILREVAGRLDTTYSELDARVERDLEQLYSYQPVTLKRGLSRANLAWARRHRGEFPELYIERHSWEREYRLGEAASHLTGYVGRISRGELSRLENRGYLPFDRVGKSGIEKTQEARLKGEKGTLRMRVDRGLNFEGFFEREAPSKGTSLVLTVDHRLQRRAYELLDGRRGAVALAAPKTGEILALVSSPGFDPNDFYTERGMQRIREQLQNQKDKPFYNRAIAGAYPPASTFKPVVAQAGLQEDLIQPDEVYEDKGYIEVGDRTFSSWKEGGHGEVDFYQAMAESVNTYFYELGIDLGVERIAGYARRFGFGSKVGVDLPGEVSGLVPTPEWKRRHYDTKWDQQWFTGDTVELSVGQSYMTATPLQVLWMTNLIANGGSARPPRLIRATLQGGEANPLPEGGSRRPQLSTGDLDEVQKSLRHVVSDADGTAHALADLPVAVAGKTGTAQTGEENKNHAWFTGYFPAGDPAYSLVVFLEHGGSGSGAAVPVAERLIRRTAETDPLGALGPKTAPGGAGD